MKPRLQIQRRKATATVLTALGSLLTGGPGIAAPSPAASADSDAIKLILARLRAEFVSAGSLAHAESVLRNQSSNGSWPDVDYADTSRARWLAVIHLERTRVLAVAYARSGSAMQGSPRASEAINRALAEWLRRRPRSSGWWQVTIGAPLELMRILTLMWDALDPSLRNEVVKLLHTPSMVPPAQATGQNLIWYATQQVVRGALLGEKSDISEASQRLQREVVITEREGIQADLSFHQHGPQLYTGGYGLSFLMDSVRMAQLLEDTPWAYQPDRLALLADYALDGVRPLLRGAWLDWSTRGREFTRRQRRSRPSVVLPSIRGIAALSPHRREELLQLAQYLADGGSDAPVVGNRHYWRSDLMVHQRRAGYASVRLFSSRTVGTESGNGENLLGFWLPFGLTYLLRSGDEYDQLPAVWNWSRLPGITSPAEIPSFSGLLFGGRPFAGGVSDGTCGVASMEMDRFETRAKKAWFFCDDLMVALGSEIVSSRATAVATTINQTTYRGEVRTAQASLGLNDSAHRLQGVGWVWHDGITYVLPPGQDVRLQLQDVMGVGRRINAELGAEHVSAKVFTLTIEHGERPAGARYAYGVWMGEAAAPPASWEPPPHLIVENSTFLQCVHHQHGRVVQAVLHQAGDVPLGEDYRLSVDRPCLLQATKTQDGWNIAVADPLQTSQEVVLQLVGPGSRHERANVSWQQAPGRRGMSALLRIRRPS